MYLTVCVFDVILQWKLGFYPNEPPYQATGDPPVKILYSDKDGVVDFAELPTHPNLVLDHVDKTPRDYNVEVGGLRILN